MNLTLYLTWLPFGNFTIVFWLRPDDFSRLGRHPGNLSSEEITADVPSETSFLV